MRVNHVWRGTIFFIVASTWFLLGAGSYGRAQNAQVRVTPGQVHLTIDPSRDSFVELAGGLQAYWSATASEQLAFRLSLTPLIDSASGCLLPADRLLVGVDDSLLGSPLDQQLFALSASEPTTLRLGVRARAFDPPGLYRGQLLLTPDGSSAQSVAYVDVQIEILPWAAIRRLAPSPLVVTAQDTPGPDAVMSSEEQWVLLVAGNHRWQLVAQAPDSLRPQSGPATAPLAGYLDMRISPTDWVQPVIDGFARLSEDPSVLAIGRPTGDWADGWVPVSLEVRMPYARHQAAGVYSGNLTLAVRPY